MKLVLPAHSIMAEEGFQKYESKGKSYLEAQRQFLSATLYSKCRMLPDEDIKPEAFKKIMPYVVFINRQGQVYLMKQSKGTFHLGLTWYIDEQQPDRFLFDQRVKPYLKEDADFYFEGTVRDSVKRAGEIAYVFSAEVDEVDISSTPLEGEWRDIADAAKYYGACDTFSQHVLNFFYEEAKNNTATTVEL